MAFPFGASNLLIRRIEDLPGVLAGGPEEQSSVRGSARVFCYIRWRDVDIEEISWVRVEHLDLTSRVYREVQNLPSFPAVPIGTGHNYTPPIQLPETQWGLIQVGEVVEIAVEVEGDVFTGTLSYSQVNRNGEAELNLTRPGSVYTYTVRYRTESRDPRSILSN